MSAIETELQRRRMAGFIKEGMAVRYHPIINEEHDGREYVVRAVDVAQGRIWLEGKAGFVTVEAVSSVEEVA
jgi:hypothetical protein